MKFRNYLLVFMTAFAASFILGSCLNDDNKIPPNCYDGILNNGEQLVDCGGPCAVCNHCIDGIWQPALGETCVDCGGECSACPPCRNCIQDGSEVGIDCGGGCGPCAALCDDGILNGTETEVDCGGTYCDPCPTCTDGEMNGEEIGIDCGGPNCLPCSTDGDCTNLIVDGNEFWVDCGGSTCPGCDTILQWKIDGAQHLVLANAINFSMAGNTLVVSGTSLTGGTININLAQPGAGWNDGVIINLDATDIPSSYINFTDDAGNVYGSGTPNSSAVFSVARYRATPLPGLIRGTFSGTLFTADGTLSVNMSSGLVMVPTQ